MAASLARTPVESVNSTANAGPWNLTFTATTAEKLIVLIEGRAAGATAVRNLTVTWNGAAVAVQSTNFTTAGPIFDAVKYWIGVIANPTTSGGALVVTADGTIPGLLVTAFFVNDADDTTPIIVHAAQANAASGNTVSLTGTPSAVGGFAVAVGAQSSNTTISSSTPTGWTSFYSGLATRSDSLTVDARYSAISALTSITATTQFALASTQIGGVLFEIVARASANTGATESVAPTDAVSAGVAISVGLTETLTPTEGVGALTGSTTSPENPAGVYRGATSSWRLPSGTDSRGANNLTVGGLAILPVTTTNVTLTTGGDLGQKLSDAYAVAAPSTTIWCPPGTYNKPGGGTWAFSRPGRIVIRPLADAWLSLLFTNPIDLTADGNIIAGIDIQNGSVVQMSAARCRITRSRIKWNGGKGVRLLDTARQCIIDRNELDGSLVAATAVGYAGIFCNDAASGTGAAHLIEFNYIHDITQFSGAGDDNSAIQIGAGIANDAELSDIVIANNLMVRCKGDNETISIRASGCWVTANTFVDSQGPIIRQGASNVLAYSWLEQISAVRVYHKSHRVIGNRIFGPGAIQILNGESSTSAWDAGTAPAANHPQSLNVLAAGNIGDLRIGTETAAAYTNPATNTRVESHEGAIYCGVATTGQTGTVGACGAAAVSTALPLSSALKLDLTEVGPTSAVILKGSAATFGTGSFARLTSPTIGSPANLTLEFWVRPTIFGGIFYLGPAGATTTNVSIRLSIDADGTWRIVRTGGGNTQTGVTAAGVAILGATTHVILALPGGAPPALYLNGISVALTLAGTAPTAAISIATTDEIALGKPTLTSLAGFAGDLGRVTLWPLAFSDTRAKIAYRIEDSTPQWVGVGGENVAAAANRAPVAVPIQETLNSGVAKTINVIARALDPDGDALSIVPGSVVSTNGTASVASGSISWTPTATFVGPATCAFQLQDGGGRKSASAIYADVTAAPPPVAGSTDLFLNPFNKLSAHHIPIGAGARWGVPPSTSYTNVRNSSPSYTGGDPPAGPFTRGRIAIIGEFRTGDDNIGRKWQYRVASGDPNKTIHLVKTGANVTTKMPNAGWFYPIKPPSGGDFNANFYPKDGVAGSKTMVLFFGFEYASAAAENKKEYQLDGLDEWDNTDGNTSGTSASALRWSATVLRGHEINDPDPPFIGHALNCTVTRHSREEIRNGRPAIPQLHVPNQKCVWPAFNIDSSAKGSVDENQGDIPYGTRLSFRNATDYATVRANIGSANKRGLRIAEAIYLYGVFVVDGQGQTVVVAGQRRAVAQLRIDGEVGAVRATGADITPTVNVGGQTKSKIIVDIDDALQASLPFLWPMYNPRPHNSRAAELHTDGKHYAGGGGPRDAVLSINTAFDA